ncbi:tRNA uridine-5-carboxymethylaminomethyl(34) synthesis GTPase MnmE [Pontibacter sp. E15-1]|uniref:tRNA uridine-5-carboxymethylaminomethyl(34) synthesis GTPase MnmE n=1 Tax=Pontibacter sp. E15-1 TaxID=2919918 RepID=UPI001F4FF138|nr:tRNA uridine-5-carboxymethylaminomethyl(34) synthesis GTPase MnmE [Pontibacter sp. E15-1]MCJ8166200.1 tRNA uridine-5-carboxymethylaminomethyl(34) synthesis GTPase MnmE [Pontibacter sp. E15-1]
MINHHFSNDTIVAVATAPGVGAIAVIRLSGPEAITITNTVFKGKDLTTQASHTIHFGTIRDADKVLDEVLVSLFMGPHSYTKEHVVEISCHGSDFIVQQIMQLLLKHGARLANAGEFTKRAFLNGQFDLAQAEAVADLIASDSALSHEVAMKQMRGGFSQEIKRLRGELVHFASMIELELDFGEEDVEFADREQLRTLILHIQGIIRELLKSFELGNVIKNGVPTVIVGKPNAGKSTLLNKLLNEEKAIVSDVPGTTRDFIEDEINISGITFRFIDTAGLRETTDKVEALGVERTMQKLSQSSLIIYLFDITEVTAEEVQAELDRLNPKKMPIVAVANKIDQATPGKLKAFDSIEGLLTISAAKGAHLEELKQGLVEKVNLGKLNVQQHTIVTNLRHVDSLNKTYAALDDVLNGLALGMSGDLVAADIRRALYSLGEITGEITTDDLLDNIFTKFCIGK